MHELYARTAARYLGLHLPIALAVLVATDHISCILEDMYIWSARTEEDHKLLDAFISPSFSRDCMEFATQELQDPLTTLTKPSTPEPAVLEGQVPSSGSRMPST